MEKLLYHFSEGNASMRDILGGKGANLAEMTRIGLPIPNGFTISTKACLAFLDGDRTLSQELKQQIDQYLEEMEMKTGKQFSNPNSLLLVSVRSGAAISMPGMMDTILNLGLNDQNVEYLADLTSNPRFAYDCYRRLLQMFGNVVYGIDGRAFEDILDDIKSSKAYSSDLDLTVDDLKEVVRRYKEVYQANQLTFPQEPIQQLYDAVKAVFASWDNDRAIVYRNLNHIPHTMGTAVNIQEMVFGNLGETSGTGVTFSRNPNTGENELFGEFLLNAQGEDVVAGIRTPKPISSLNDLMPKIYYQFNAISEKLERHYGDMQDIEFTVENGKLFILQTRNGKRTAKSALNIAYEMAMEGIVDKGQALMQINPSAINQLLHPMFDPNQVANFPVITDSGLAASPGAAVGHIYFDAATAKEHNLMGERVILMRQETSPEDIEGMVSSAAIVTSRGGLTSHAAVVARGMGTCCVVGCEDIRIKEAEKVVEYPGGVLHEGDLISVDGSTGTLYLGEVPTIPSEADERFEKIMTWAREIADMKVRMNAETPSDIETGLRFKAAGIGLVRTEHMFFGSDRLPHMRRFILAENDQERQAALDNLINFQKEDFSTIFQQMEGLPVVVRLLDPPLHEFVPSSQEDIAQVAKQLEMDPAKLNRRVLELHEVNPMLGHRGVRLAISYPMLYQMQVQAIIEAALELKAQGINVEPEIMIPLVGMKEELKESKAFLEKRIQAIFDEKGGTVDYQIGTMVELPRACLTADQLAEDAEFISFGTNDLTQMTYGFSRDDAGKFIQSYIKDRVLAFDPFQTIDQEGVGELVKIASQKARASRPGITMGVCGELGGDPKSIEFFHNIGLDYVSCSPFRLPVAQLAAAQATIKQPRKY